MCFDFVCIQNHDNRLSFEEFDAWFSEDFDGGDEEDDDEGDEEEEGGEEEAQGYAVTLDTVKRVTTLGSRSVDSVLEAFAVKANDDGVVTREAFYDVFSDIMGPLSEEDAEMASIIVPSLFNLFDSNDECVTHT